MSPRQSPPPFAHLSLWDDRVLPRAGAENMALDEAMLTWAAESRQPVLRVYRWDRPTLSFGYFLTESEALASRRPGEAMIRRWTGGGIVHHEGAVTWSLAVPASEPFAQQVRPAASYALLHQWLAACLTDAGLVGLQAVPAQAPAPAGGLCAEGPAPGDLLWKGRKIAGAGQRRTRLGLLHQGVIFLPENTLPPDFPPRLARTFSTDFEPCHLPAGPILPLVRYQAPAWNSRR